MRTGVISVLLSDHVLAWPGGLTLNPDKQIMAGMPRPTA